MKKTLSLLLSISLVASMIIGCGGSSDQAAETSAAVEDAVSNAVEEADAQDASEDPLTVCLIVNLLGDQSFADAAYSGLLKAEEEFGDRIETRVSQCEDQSLYEQQVLTACEEGYDLVICGGSAYGEYLKKHCTSYPDIMFGIMDTVVDGPNVCSVTFAQNQGSFLAGAAAAKFTQLTQIPNVNEEKIVGWVGGDQIPALKDFFIGFEEGVKYVDPEVQILQSYAGTFQDPLLGKELTLAMYDQGADIVMNVASNTGNGVLEAAAESGYYAIGVDINQDNNQPGAILTSMLKQNGEGVYYVIKNALEGTFEGGTSLYMDLAKGGVDLTDMSVFKEHLETDEQRALIDEILEYVADLKEKIISGEIVVSNYEGYGPNA